MIDCLCTAHNLFFSVFISLRYLFNQRKNGLVFLFGIISLGGIVVTVAAFFIIHSVMNGFSSYLQNSLMGFDAHIQISAINGPAVEADLERSLKSDRRVLEIFPALEFDALLKTTEGIAGGVKVRGQDLDKTLGPDSLQIFTWDEDSPASNLPVIYLGEELYSHLQFLPGSEEKVEVLHPFGDVGPSGEVEPRSRAFKVGGLFRTGFYNYDMQYVLMPLAEAEKLGGGAPATTFVRLKKSSWDQAGKIVAEYKNRYGGHHFVTWAEKNSRLFAALKLEKKGMVLLLVLVIFVASMSLLSLMSVMVMGRLHDVSLLFCLGAGRPRIRAIFLQVGFLMGVLGVVLGLGLGYFGVWLLKTHPLPLPGAYYLEVLPVKVDVLVIFLLLFLTPLLTALASLWPAYRVSEVNPVESLRWT